MLEGFKLVESCKYRLGENHDAWYLYAGLHQKRDSYFYCIFDKEESEKVIVSAIVSPKTANDLESALLEAINRPQRLENIYDVFTNLQNTFYGNMFQMQEIQ